MKYYIRTAIAALIAWSALYGHAVAQIKVHRHLRVEDGLVQSQVNAILEDSGGYVWFGTFGGLSRWDGLAFENFQTQDGLGSLDIRVIHELPDGTMLFGTSETGISVLKHNKFKNVDESRGLPANSVRAILRDDGGGLMVATSKGLVIFADASFDTTEAVYLLPGISVSGLEKRRAGGFYVSTFGDGVFVLVDGTIRPLDPAGILPEQIIRAIHETPDGTLWISVYKNGLWLYDNGELRPFQHNGALAGNDVKAITATRDGTLYLSTLGAGVAVYQDGSLELISADNGLANPISWCAHEGTSGVIYLGTWSGVNLYQPGRIETLNELSGLPENVVTSVAETADGTFYIGSIGGGVAEYDGQVRRVYKTADGLAHNQVWSLCAARDGTLYIGTHAGVNALKDGSLRTVYYEPRELRGRVYQIYQAQDGTLYFGTYGGVCTYQNNTLQELYEEPDRGRASIYAVLEAHDSTMYFGTGHGVVTCRQGRIEYPDLPDPLDHIRVWSIYEDDDGTMYFGTNGSGLCMLRRDPGRGWDLDILDVTHGLSDNTVYTILQDDDRRLYLSTHRGVNIVDLASTVPHTRLLRHSDGLGSDECNQGAGFKDSLGRMWFGNNGGVSRYDPQHDPPDLTPPQVHFSRVRLFEDELPLEAFAPEVPFAHHQNYFRFAFVATYPPAPDKVVYRYRLSGIDRDWVEARERSVQYTALPHGVYTFAVSARNDWGIWSAPAMLHFRIAAPFWKTWWFIALVVLAAGGAIALSVNNRVRHLLAIERLRTKIAADLHDDIGAGLTEISITSDVIAHKLPDKAHETVSAELERISIASRHLVDSMSDIVWLVNPKRDSLHDLLARLGDVYKDAAGSANVRFRVNNVEALKNVRLRMEHRQHIFLLFKEAINNAFKHGQCSEIKLEVANHAGGATIRLEDNGRGFDLEAVRSGNGLDNMMNRAVAIKAGFHVESSPGGGTIVSLTL